MGRTRGARIIFISQIREGGPAHIPLRGSLPRDNNTGSGTEIAHERIHVKDRQSPHPRCEWNSPLNQRASPKGTWAKGGENVARGLLGR